MNKQLIIISKRNLMKKKIYPFSNKLKNEEKIQSLLKSFLFKK